MSSIEKNQELLRIMDEWSKDPIVCRFLFLQKDPRIIQYFELVKLEIVKEYYQLWENEKVKAYYQALDDVEGKHSDDQDQFPDIIG